MNSIEGLVAGLGVAALTVIGVACGGTEPQQAPASRASTAGLTNDSSTGEAPAKAGKIVCHAAYRASVTVPIEREETITFTDSDAQQSINFADLDWHAKYGTGELDGERALLLWVTAAGQPDRLLSQLYQLPLESGPQNQFRGGHGFTGLNYTYHPASPAELQFWCETD